MDVSQAPVNSGELQIRRLGKCVTIVVDTIYFSLRFYFLYVGPTQTCLCMV